MSLMKMTRNPIRMLFKEAKKQSLHTAWKERNPERNRELQENWRKNNKEAKERHNLKRIGITPEEKQALLANQGFKCACCDRDLKDAPTKIIHVDHNHTTGKIRGILCQKCNTTVGLLGDTLAKVTETTSRFLSYLTSKDNTEDE